VKQLFRVIQGHSFGDHRKAVEGLISCICILDILSVTNDENCALRQFQCRLTPPVQGTPANIRIYLLFFRN